MVEKQTLGPVGTSTRDERWISEDEAAEIDGLSVSWHQRARWSGTGPPYAKLGRAVRYKLSDIHAFMASRVRVSTSDPGIEQDA